MIDDLEADLPQEPDLEGPDTLLGMKLGEYELRRRIGVGGMGLVYEGIQPLIGKRVAVKVLRPELASGPDHREQVARLLAEARAVNAIRHRGIVDIFGFGQLPDGRQYIIMEFLEGQALDAYLAQRRRLPAMEVLDILDEVLSALAAAHGAGVVHRDLKPSNIFLVRQADGSRYVKLLDFGLAKQAQGPSRRTAQTRTDMVVGTPEYMAPEQARGQAVGPMTDLYSLGVVAFEMVTGRLPFTGDSPVELLMQHVERKPPRPSEVVPELPPALDTFILQMLTKDPEVRPGSAELLRRSLQGLREAAREQMGLPSESPAARSPQAPPAAPSLRSGAPVLAPSLAPAPRSEPDMRPTPVLPTPAVSEPPAARPAAPSTELVATVRPRSRLPLVLGLVAASALVGVALVLVFARAEPTPTSPEQPGTPVVTAPAPPEVPAEPPPQAAAPDPTPPEEAIDPSPLQPDEAPPAQVKAPPTEQPQQPAQAAVAATPPETGTSKSPSRRPLKVPSSKELVSIIESTETLAVASAGKNTQLVNQHKKTARMLRGIVERSRTDRDRIEAKRLIDGWVKDALPDDKP
jgi:serine/threonine protein kinase